MTPLVKDFYYNVPVAEVWNALTNSNTMKQWYFPQLIKFEPTVGYHFQFENDNQEYQKKWIVTEVVDGKRLAHSWAYQGFSGTSDVSFDLFSDNGMTRLQVTQTGIESFPVHPHFRRERFEWGWNNLLGQNLRLLLERSESRD